MDLTSGMKLTHAHMMLAAVWVASSLLSQAKDWMDTSCARRASEGVLVDLQVHSVVFAASGTLLLCCTDTSGVLACLRSKIRKTFPGMTPCMHAELARVQETVKSL